MIERLENNTKGQSVLPFKLKLKISTPSKRSRGSVEDEDVQSSPAKIRKNEGCRKEVNASEDGSRPRSPTAGPPSSPGQVLQEPSTPTPVRSIQGGTIIGSNSFPQTGPTSRKFNFNEQQNNTPKQQNNSSNFSFKISRHSSLKPAFSHDRSGTQGKTPKRISFSNSSPGENNRNKVLAPHNGQGETSSELFKSSEDHQNPL